MTRDEAFDNYCTLMNTLQRHAILSYEQRLDIDAAVIAYAGAASQEAIASSFAAARETREPTLEEIHDAGHGTYFPGPCPECAELEASRAR